MKNKMLKPIFIGGTGRSGTSILKRVLQQHSNIVNIPNELRIIIDPDGILDLVSSLTQRFSTNRADIAIVRFMNLISRCGKGNYLDKTASRLKHRINFWPLTGQNYRCILSFFGDEYVRDRTQNLLEELTYHQSKAELIHSTPYSFRSIVYESGPFDKEEIYGLINDYINDLYCNLANSKTTCWVDDTPLNILHANELAGLFKDMKLIHIYRDPRDVVASYYTKKWGGDQFATVARRVAGIYHQWHQVKKGLPSQQLIEISLEELSANPKPTLQKICDHIGLEFEEGLLDTKLDKSNSGRWKRDIPSEDLESVLGHIEPFLNIYGTTM